MEELSIHDNYVTGYSVMIEEKKIILNTEFRDRGEPFERTDVIFEGVEAYLIYDSLGGILFDIDEIDLDYIIKEYRHEFKKNVKYSWPGPWNESSDAVRAFVRENGLTTYQVHSSIGFDGFIISKSMRKVKAEQPARVGRS
jgi:hypothetical protein